MDHINLFEEELNPLMQQVIQLCEKYKIPLFTELQIVSNVTCSYCIFPDIANRAEIIHLHHLLSFANGASDGNIMAAVMMFNARAILHYGVDLNPAVHMPKHIQFSIN